MNQFERLKTIISRMILKKSYWGYLFGRIRRVSSDSIPSIMAVCPERDGTLVLKFSSALLENTDNKTIELILEHEGLHILNKHVPRLLKILSNELSDKIKEKKASVWSTAADCAVNDLFDIPNELMINNIPWAVCKSKLYGFEPKQSTEVYFNLLWNKLKDQENGETDIFEFYGAGEDYDSIDDHSEWDKIEKEVSDINSLSRKIDDYSKTIIQTSLKMYTGDSKDDLPAYLRELIDEALAPPKAPYFQIIRNLIVGTKVSKFKRHYSKINRKRTYVFAIGDKENIPQISPFPGRTRDLSFNIGIVIDTSGSQSKDDIHEALSGCKNIIENDRHCKVTVLEIDTKIHNEYEIKRISDIQMRVKGRGGTILAPGLERCKELGVDVSIVFTDGYCEDINSHPRSKLPKKIIWAIESERGTAEYVNRTGYIIRI